MKTCIVLLRGINVLGRGLLPMKELVGLLEAMGCRDVRTYIQSGNVALRCAPKLAANLPARLGRAIGEKRGFEPRILLLNPEEIDAAVEANPFPDVVADPKSLHLAFLDAAPATPDRAALESVRSASERYELADRVLYLHAPEGFGRSKLAARAERLLGVAATFRNWRTVCKISDMARALE